MKSTLRVVEVESQFMFIDVSLKLNIKTHYSHLPGFSAAPNISDIWKEGLGPAGWY